MKSALKRIDRIESKVMARQSAIFQRALDRARVLQSAPDFIDLLQNLVDGDPDAYDQLVSQDRVLADLDREANLYSDVIEKARVYR